MGLSKPSSLCAIARVFNHLICTKKRENYILFVILVSLLDNLIKNRVCKKENIRQIN